MGCKQNYKSQRKGSRAEAKEKAIGKHFDYITKEIVDALIEKIIKGAF